MTAWRTRVVTACGLVSAAVAVSSGQSGVGGISGTVVTTGVPSSPLARVLVTITGPPLASSRTAITDDHGHYVFDGLPAGAFMLTAARLPYVKTAFGARRPGRPGTPVALSPGQRIDDVIIPLARGAVISGLVRTPGGEPAPDVTVRAVPPVTESALSTASAVTDDRGVYRIFGLTPGDYSVTAVVSSPDSDMSEMSDTQMDDILARLRGRPGSSAGGRPSASGPAGVRMPSVRYAPIYYPGTPDADEAETISLAEGGDREGVNLDLQLVPTVTVQGRVSGPGAAVTETTSVILVRQGRTLTTSDGQLSESPTTRLDAGGAFEFAGVVPGRYRVSVVAGRATATPMWAAAEIAVRGDDIAGLTLTLEPTLRLSGRLLFEVHAGTPRPDVTSVSVALTGAAGEGTGLPARVGGGPGGTRVVLGPIAGSGRGRTDGTFEIDGVVPGTYAVDVRLPDSQWTLQSVVMGGRDITDGPFEIEPGRDLAEAVVTLTDLHTELSGTLTAASVPAPAFVVAVFPSDRSLWRTPSRRIRSTRPATDGQFAFHDLPAGDYLLAALTDAEPSDLADARFLLQLATAGLPVHLTDGEQKKQDIAIAR